MNKNKVNRKMQINPNKHFSIKQMKIKKASSINKQHRKNKILNYTKILRGGLHIQLYV